jgi:hypothetical protein
MSNDWNVVELFERPKGNTNMSVGEAHRLVTNALGWIRTVKDEHFVKYVYNDINTLQDVLNLLTRLDADHEDHTEPGVFRWGCTKAKGIRHFVENSIDVILTNTERLRLAIAINRRLVCSCHETGSYKPRNQLHIGHAERFSPRLAQINLQREFDKIYRKE